MPQIVEAQTVEASGVTALAYVELTVAAMRAWGATVEQVGRAAWRVRSGQPYATRTVVVEYDASAACHLFGLAAATGGRVTVTNAVPDSRQPDAGFVAVLERMGVTTSREGDALTVTGPARLAPVGTELSAMPDQVTTLAVLAALAEGESEIRGVAVARGHETDRLNALATELGKLGIDVTELPDGLRVAGGGARGPARLATHDDHRLAMAFAALAAAVPGVVIDEPWCVTKTYPAFWDDARRLGLDWSEVG
jgi:3-phosphoshikimate 1-carboxyvinyltransferase